jgi:hypothetical protein
LLALLNNQAKTKNNITYFTQDNPDYDGINWVEMMPNQNPLEKVLLQADEVPFLHKKMQQQDEPLEEFLLWLMPKYSSKQGR